MYEPIVLQALHADGFDATDLFPLASALANAIVAVALNRLGERVPDAILSVGTALSLVVSRKMRCRVPWHTIGPSIPAVDSRPTCVLEPPMYT